MPIHSDPRPDPAAVSKLSHLPVALQRPRQNNLIYVSRVPAVGEIIFLPTGLNEDREEPTQWRVTCVQHIPPFEGFLQSIVAEIHAVEVENHDAWNGEHPSQSD